LSPASFFLLTRWLRLRRKGAIQSAGGSLGIFEGDSREACLVRSPEKMSDFECRDHPNRTIIQGTLVMMSRSVMRLRMSMLAWLNAGVELKKQGRTDVEDPGRKDVSHTCSDAFAEFTPR